MEKDEARKHLPEWLQASAVQSALRPPFQNPQYDSLCSEAFRVLGEGEYTRIYEEWRKEFRGR